MGHLVLAKLISVSEVWGHAGTSIQVGEWNPAGWADTAFTDNTIDFLSIIQWFQKMQNTVQKLLINFTAGGKSFHFTESSAAYNGKFGFQMYSIEEVVKNKMSQRSVVHWGLGMYNNATFPQIFLGQFISCNPFLSGGLEAELALVVFNVFCLAADGSFSSVWDSSM